MTEALYAHDHDDSDYSDDDERSTSYLAPETTPAPELRALPGGKAPSEPDTDWLALLSKRDTETAELDDEEPQPLPSPSGMSDHIAPPRMRPTVGARLTTGLRRGTLFAALTALALGLLAGGAYLVSQTTWFTSAVNHPPAVQQPAPADIPPPAVGRGGSPAQDANGDVLEPDQAPRDAANVSGATAVRDKGIEEFRAGNYSIAIDLLENATLMNANDPLTFYQLGLAYMAANGREHALEDAELAFRTASSLDTKWAAPHRLLAESLLRRGFYNEAITEANTSIKLDPDQADAWMTLSRAYKGAGNDAAAKNALDEALRHAPAAPR